MITKKLFIFFIFFTHYSFALNDSDSTFLNNIESQIRHNYQTCTGDTSYPPLQKVLHWKQNTDELINSPKFQIITKQYTESHPETHASPCEIVEWYTKKMLSEKNGNSAKPEMKSVQNHTEDSIAAKNELSKLKKSRCDYQTIPFGVTRKTFETLANKAKLPSLSDGGNYFYFTNDQDLIFNTLAFYFDTTGKYYKYEIESVSKPIDSLDNYIRFYSEQISLYFQNVIGAAAKYNNYVGRFEILQGKLSIQKSWKTQNTTVYVGLATFNNKYYAKAVIEKIENSKPQK